MFRTDIFKSAGQEIIEYFFDQIYDLLASDDPQKVKTHIQKIQELEARGCIQIYNSYLNRYTFYATISKSNSEGYTVALNSIGRASCTCPSYEHRHFKKEGYCKHIIALALMLEKPQNAKKIAVQIMRS
jgi:uncharacterized Zn finger protein